MSIKEQKPLVLYQYDRSEDKLLFKKNFSDNFTIFFSASDAETEQFLLSHSELCCVFLDKTEIEAVLNSPLVEFSRRLPSSPPVFLLGQDINIEAIAQLLKARAISKCYGKPYDPNIIRSDVFAAKMNLKHLYAKNVVRSSEYENPSVLLVDDESLATKYLAKQLQQINHDIPILTADNGDQALELLSQADHNIAVVISDQRMPGIKGNQLLNEIQKSHPQVIRILTSAYQEVDVALGAINEGKIFQYLKKPWDAHEISETIREAIIEYQRLCRDVKEHQTTLDSTHQQIIEHRAVMLQETLGDLISPVVNKNTVIDFIDFLRAMKQGKVINSTIRASEETELEAELVSEFKNKVASLTDDLKGLVEIEREAKNKVVREIFNQLGLLDNHETREINSEKQRIDTRRVASIAVAAIDTLLVASNLERSALNHSSKDPDEEGAFKHRFVFSIFKHLLSPLSSVSKTLVEHQSAMFVLFVFRDLFNHCFEISLDKNGCDVAIRLVPSFAQHELAQHELRE